MFASPSASAQRAVEVSVDLNWYLSRNAKWALQFTRTGFDGGAASGDRAPEYSLLGRIQIAF